MGFPGQTGHSFCRNGSCRWDRWCSRRLGSFQPSDHILTGTRTYEVTHFTYRKWSAKISPYLLPFTLVLFYPRPHKSSPEYNLKATHPHFQIARHFKLILALRYFRKTWCLGRRTRAQYIYHCNLEDLFAFSYLSKRRFWRRRAPFSIPGPDMSVVVKNIRLLKIYLLFRSF